MSPSYLHRGGSFSQSPLCFTTMFLHRTDKLNTGSSEGSSTTFLVSWKDHLSSGEILLEVFSRYLKAATGGVSGKCFKLDAICTLTSRCHYISQTAPLSGKNITKEQSQDQVGFQRTCIELDPAGQPDHGLRHSQISAVNLTRQCYYQ